MGSQTPKLALPYPVGTDRVMDGDDAIRALAEAVETRFGDAPAMSMYLTGNANAASGFIQLSVFAQGWKVGNIALGSNAIAVAVTGLYVVTGAVSWGAGTGAARRGCQIRRNLTTALTTSTGPAVASGASGQVSIATVMTPLVAGDTLALYSWHDSATSQPISGGTDQSLTYLQAACLGRT